MERRGGAGPAGLQPEVARHAGRRTRRSRRFVVAGRAARESAAPARRSAGSPCRVADGSSPIASSICGRRSRIDKRLDQRAQRAAAGRRSSAAARGTRRHVGDEARLALVEADQHAALLARRGGPTAARDGGTPTRARAIGGSSGAGRTRPMRASASSSARCFAATCSAGSACCSEQPPQTPKCGTARRRRATRLARCDRDGARDVVGRLALERSVIATRSPGSAPSTNTALPSTCATPRPSWSSDSIVTTRTGSGSFRRAAVGSRTMRSGTSVDVACARAFYPAIANPRGLR